MKDIFNKRQRFSIRKFSVGVASVLIGVSLFAPTQGVLASTENNNDNNNEQSTPQLKILARNFEKLNEKDKDTIMKMIAVMIEEPDDNPEK